MVRTLLAAARGAGLEVVADHRPQHAADVTHRVDVHADPVGQPFRPSRLRIEDLLAGMKITTV
jgi:hypothetical protein